ncbi:MAG: folylpolyglutamate synthase/dihydrofolate synthase family protein, partial [Myxococcota bacterium]
MPRGRSHEPIRTAEQAAAYLGGLLDVEKSPDVPYDRLGLAAVRRLLERLGNPQDGLAVVHVAGSKGKGSTALLAEALYRAAGQRVATFTSPHLERWTERFRIDAREVDGARLAGALERLRPHVDALRAEGPSRAPTFFDATTAAALLLFREANVRRVILEVGLGGRLDSTNVVTPAVACITSVELEHTDKLGTTLAQIAREKAGVLKPGVPAVVGDLPAEAREVVAARARELAVPVAWFGEDFCVELLRQGSRGLQLRLSDGPLRVEVVLPLLGAHQATNAALAMACVRRAGGLSDAALASAAARAFAAAELPARVEVFERAPWVVVDVAHTAASARALVRALSHLPRRRTQLVISISAGKDVAGVLGWLLPCASEVIVTRAEATRSLPPAELAAA